MPLPDRLLSGKPAMRPRRICQFLRPRLELLEDRRVLACEVPFVREGTLFVTGDDNSNHIILGGFGRDLEVTCDGQTQSFASIDAVVIRGLGGDDHYFDAHMHTVAEWFLANPLNLFAPRKSYDGGDGFDTARLVLGDEDETTRFAGAATCSPNDPNVPDDCVRTDVVIQFSPDNRLNAAFSTSNSEQLEIEQGDGDDSATIDNRDGLLGGVAIQLFGQGGNDDTLYGVANLTQSVLEGVGLTEIDGGEGQDSFRLQAARFSELIEYLDVPETSVADRRIRVTDSARNAVAFQGIVADTEQLTIESGGGDDIFDVAIPPPAETEITLSGQGSSPQPPSSHRMYRLFEFLSTDDRATRISPRGRVPGQININGVVGEDQVIVYGDRNGDI